MDQALQELGATPDLLTDAERDQLSRDGYIVVADFFDAEWLGDLTARMEELWAEEGATAGVEVHQQPGTRRLADLVNKGAVFDQVWQNPKLLAAAYFLIGRPFKLFSLNARDALPGEGGQPLHADWGPRQADEPCRVINSVWMLDPFTKESGATRIVPGSHRLPGSAHDHVANLEIPHPQEQLALGDPGTVLIYNAHAWHGGTTNSGDSLRRGLHCSYVDRDFPQQTNQREYIRPETFVRLSPAAKFLLDVD